MVAIHDSASMMFFRARGMVKGDAYGRRSGHCGKLVVAAELGSWYEGIVGKIVSRVRYKYDIGS
jgi:hypothetical protein